MKFSIKNFYSKYDQIRRGLVTFTEEILNGKLLFLCAVETSKTNFETNSFENLKDFWQFLKA